MANTYLDIDTSNGRITRHTATDVSAGGADAGKIPALNSSGKFDSTLIDLTGITGTTYAITATEALSDGDWINIYYSSGKKCRKALATDTTKPANGFVLAAVSNGATATVYTSGVNAHVALTGFTTSEIGKPVFLSAGTSGGSTKTPPSTAGNFLQQVGKVNDVTGSFVEVQFDIGVEIVM
jgi:hypothetical protein